MTGAARGQRIRVLYLIQTLGVGGAESHLIQVLRHLDRERFAPAVACLSELGPLAEEVRSLDVPLYLLGGGGTPLNLAGAMRTGVRLLRDLRPQVLHTYLYRANLLGGIMGRWSGVPVLVTSRRGLGTAKDGKPYLQWMENLINRTADAITVNSAMVQRDVLARERFVQGKLHLIYNGVQWERFSAPQRPPGPMRAELGVPVDAAVVGCVGTLLPYKGHRELLAAFAQVLPCAPETYLVLVGLDRGGIQPELQRQAEALGIAGRVRFAGERRDVPDLLHAFDLHVLASHEEGFSNAILEAMAVGLPVVATDVGGNAEAILHGQTGLIVPRRDPGALAGAMAALLRDPAAARAMGLAGQQRVREHFSPEQMALKMARLYEDLLARKGIDQR